MKKLFYFLSMVSFSLLLISCDDSNNNTKIVTYDINEPVFMKASDFRNSVKLKTTPVEIKKQGKICFYQGFLYISDPEKGIHIIDNRNPSSPKNVGYIELLGNVDLAVRNDILYADAYVDLVWFDLANPAKPTLKGRMENVFENALPAIENNHSYDYGQCYPGNTAKDIIVGWKVATRREVVRTDVIYCYDSASSNSMNKGNGANGSMSRFSVYKDNLYIVTKYDMNIFSLTGGTPVEVGEKVPMNRVVETIFSYKECLFIGTPTGILIYSVQDPLKPVFKSSLQHVYGCDPVVVEDDIAYVTVRSGTLCGQNINELLVIDVSNIDEPKSIVSYAMKNPKGLGIDNGTLFLCDDGLKIFKSDDPQKLIASQLKHYKGMDGFDVIPYNGVLMMIADDGLYQYDYSNLQNIKQLSKIAIGN